MAVKKRPVIGVSGPDRGGGAAWICTRFAVFRAGGRARRIMPARPLPIEALDGLIIGGGADVDPRLYGEERQEVLPELRAGPKGFTARLKNLLVLPLVLLLRQLFSAPAGLPGDAARDRLEKTLIDQAVRNRLPVLGICRGAQLLNVYFGGTLHQDLLDFYTETPQIRTVLPRKRIVLATESRLARILATRATFVNALHRQAVNRLGNGIVAVAREPNGVIQAIEHRGEPFLLGVQWHPEYLPQEKAQQRIFAELVAAARRQAR